MGPELAFLFPFIYYQHKIDSFCGFKFNFELLFLKKEILILRKSTIKMNKITPNIPCSHKTSILEKKNEFQNKSFQFRILRKTSFFMIPFTFLYDEYIDRPKLSEQKKPI